MQSDNGASGQKLSAGPSLPPRPEGFRGTSVLIVGDVMVDCYVVGDVHRISQEAPVPVVALRQQRWGAGGAANVATNVAGLRGTAIVAGVVGNDSPGQRLTGILHDHGIHTDGLVIDASRPTTCKTRIMSGNHQIVRLDEEVTSELERLQAEELLGRIMGILNTKPDAVILSDYAKGVLSDALLAEIIAGCRERGIPAMVDPKKVDYLRYAGATCVTPNFHEFQEALLTMGIPRRGLLESGPLLRQAIGTQSLLVTQGGEGMTLFRAGRTARHMPALAQEVFDVSGAGDTVIATLATCLGAGLEMEDAMLLANMAASIVVTKVGTAPIHWDDLERVLEEHHLMETSCVSGSVRKEPAIGRAV
jgi:D-beta-D-heptose 7-phosphate kinase / D-beta-D-heptose 1-phosphate adenosyltransferase